MMESGHAALDPVSAVPPEIQWRAVATGISIFVRQHALPRLLAALRASAATRVPMAFNRRMLIIDMVHYGHSGYFIDDDNWLIVAIAPAAFERALAELEAGARNFRISTDVRIEV